MNDGKVQLSFTLPVEWSEAADEAARQLVGQDGFCATCRWSMAAGSRRGFSFFVVYASTPQGIDVATINGAVGARRTRCRWKRSTRYVNERLGRKIRIAGACIGTDAHTVGIDAILNMKGYKGDYGLERYHAFETYNLGSQVAVEDLVRFAQGEEASTRSSHRKSSRRRAATSRTSRRLANCSRREVLRDRIVLICGGPRVTNLLASELGYDAGFGRGTLPSEVAGLHRRNAWRSASGWLRGRTEHTCLKPRSLPGITGQDGSYLAELLLRKGYRVVGMTRRTSTEVHERIEHIVDDVEIVSGDLLDQMLDHVDRRRRRARTKSTISPRSRSCRRRGANPCSTGEFTALGVTRVLEAIRQVNPADALLPSVEFRDVRQRTPEMPQTRDDRVLSAQPVRRGQGLRPLDHGELPRVVRTRSPCSGILLQPREPAPRQRVRHAQDLRRRRAHQTRPGRRARAWEISTPSATGALPGDYVRAMWLMLQHETPDDYVIATGPHA